MAATAASTRDFFGVCVGLLVGTNKAFLLEEAFWEDLKHLVVVACTNASWFWCVANMMMVSKRVTFFQRKSIGGFYYQNDDDER